MAVRREGKGDVLCRVSEMRKGKYVGKRGRVDKRRRNVGGGGGIVGLKNEEIKNNDGER